MKEELLKMYEKTTAAHRTILGFAIGKIVYMIIVERLSENWVELTNEANGRGGKNKLRLNLNKWDKAKLKNKAIAVGTTEIINTIKGNKGDSWEKWVSEHYGITWKKSQTIYTEDGDITVAGEKLQIKWENATLALENTIRNAVKLA